MTKLANFASLKTALEKTSSPVAIRSYLGACGVAVSLLGGSIAADAQGMPPPPPTLIGPAMTGPISANPTPFSMDLGFLGDHVYAGGALTGIAWIQDGANRGPYDYPTGLDISNAQLFVQKTDGFFQYFIEAGAYSFPSLATAFSKSTATTEGSFGVVPVAFVKIVPTDTFSIMAGKLPTLVGGEYTFSFENMNIIRGLLWNIEPAFSTGVQANLTTGPLAWSVSLNDGYYSNRFNWISGSVAWTIDGMNTLAFVGAGNMGHTGYDLNGDTGVPTALNNGMIFNLLYTHTDGPLVVTAYGQYEATPGYKTVEFAETGTTCFEGHGGSCTFIDHAGHASSWGAAILATYSFTDNWKLAGRVEYISESASAAPTDGGCSATTCVNAFQTDILGITGAPNTSAWSFTVTPTYIWKNFYARAEYSLVSLASGGSGSQDRGMLEVGVLY